MPWLTLADSDKLTMFCVLQAEFEKNPDAMVTARLTQLRALGSELGGDPASRERIGAREPADPTQGDLYFND